MVKEILYDSFGRILEDTNPAMIIPVGFGGGLHDRDVGWVRMGYRDYDPETARFTAKDPLGPLGGSSDLYDYCLDDPINLVDPEGLKPKKAGADSAEEPPNFVDKRAGADSAQPQPQPGEFNHANVKKPTNWKKVVTPPLLLPHNDEDYIAATNIMKKELTEYGEVLLNHAPSYAGIIQEAGDDGFELEDIPRRLIYGVRKKKE